MLVNTIEVEDGEIAVYQDSDGFHAELWSESKQWIAAQSSDCETAEEAIKQLAVQIND